MELVYLQAGFALNLEALKAKAIPITANRAIRERKILAFFMVFYQNYLNVLFIKLGVAINSLVADDIWNWSSLHPSGNVFVSKSSILFCPTGPLNLTV